MKVGRWTVTNVEKKGDLVHHTMYCKCICDCGRVRWVRKTTLKHGRTFSCKSCCQSRLYTYKGQQYTLRMLSNMTGKNRVTISTRLAAGWSVEHAVEVPRFKKRKWLKAQV